MRPVFHFLSRRVLAVPAAIWRAGLVAPAMNRSALLSRHFSAAKAKANTIEIVFVSPSGQKTTVKGLVGDSLLEIAHANNIDIEGACGGEVACSTCHVILAPEAYAKLPAATDEEEDMLDLASGLTKTSRLGCQVIAAPELDGMVVTLPSEVINRQQGS